MQRFYYNRVQRLSLCVFFKHGISDEERILLPASEHVGPMGLTFWGLGWVLDQVAHREKVLRISLEADGIETHRMTLPKNQDEEVIQLIPLWLFGALDELNVRLSRGP